MEATTTSRTANLETEAALARVLCGVDGSRADHETVRQAATLAGAGGRLDLVCVAYERGSGPSAQATISYGHADRALGLARRWARREVGVDASLEVIRNPADWDGLSGAMGGHDLLVLGPGRAKSRLGGIVLGSTVTRALHEAPLPVLIARPPQAGFLERIMFATDGSASSDNAAAIAVTIARDHGASVTVLAGGSTEDAERRHKIAVQTAAICHATDVEPAVVDVRGGPRTAIVGAVATQRPSLVVLGSGGKRGIRAIGSVSEHVAHHAACSVLVARQ